MIITSTNEDGTFRLNNLVMGDRFLASCNFCLISR